MEVPRIWRLKKQRYALKGSQCPDCKEKYFPPRDICPECGYYELPQKRDTQQVPTELKVEVKSEQ